MNLQLQAWYQRTSIIECQLDIVYFWNFAQLSMDLKNQIMECAEQ